MINYNKSRMHFLKVALWVFLATRVGTATSSEAVCDDSDGVCTASVSGPRKVVVFSNGNHEGGQRFVFKEEDCARVEDVSSLLAPLFPELCQPKGCKLYNAIGQRWRSCADLPVLEEAMVFLVPEHRPFMWPSIEVGHAVTIDHIDDLIGQQNLTVETLSTSPRVFRLHNFFTAEEADMLVNHMLKNKDESERLKRSSVGATGYTVNSERTSENGFDNFSPVAMALKRRSFELLGFEEYKESWVDGLQVLRYNLSTAYNPHMDPFPVGEDQYHNYDSAGKGSNRYATILLYMTDVEEGGETVFPKAPAADGSMMPLAQAVDDVRERKLVEMFERRSWQERMVAECQHRLAVKPKKGDAILFYSQNPDGTVDENSLHGGCPVLSGTKWAANIWIWNGPRVGYTKLLEDGSLIDTLVPDEQPFVAVFHNMDVPGAELLWHDNWRDTDSFIGKIDIGKDLRVNTRSHHIFHFNDVKGNTLQAFQIPGNDYKGLTMHVWFSKDDGKYALYDKFGNDVTLTKV